MMMRQVTLQLRSAAQPSCQSATAAVVLRSSPAASSVSSRRSLATAPNPSLDLKAVLAKKIVEHQKRVKEIRSVYGSKGFGEVTVEQVSPPSHEAMFLMPCLPSCLLYCCRRCTEGCVGSRHS